MLSALAGLVEDTVHLALAQRHGLVVLAQKARDLRHILDQVINLVGQFGVEQHIARQEFVLGLDLLAAAHFQHFLGGHHHIGDEFFQILDLGLAQNLFLHLLLEIRVGVHDVPFGIGHGTGSGFAHQYSLRAPINSISP